MRTILQNLAAGTINVEEALRALSRPEAADFAHVDHGREERCGFPEVIFAEHKTPPQCVAIAEQIFAASGLVLLTRCPPEVVQAIRERWPQAEHDPAARTLLVGQTPPPRPGSRPVAVLAAGTSDLPVAQEAAVTARAMGCPVETAYDCGVAGLHRLLGQKPLLQRAGVVIAVAGMEGALPSVVGGLVRCPVIAVPTSVGYGASFGGVAALLAMLNSCASGIGVVNIDNGFGAGCLAARILHTAQGEQT